MSNPKPFEREPNGKRFALKGGMNLVKSPDMMVEGEYAYLQNVRAYIQDRVIGRNTQSIPIITLDSSVQSIRRLNDTTPAGPAGGFIIVSSDIAGNVYANAAPVVSGQSGNPVAHNPFRPNTSVQPWDYIGDSAPYPNVIVSSAFRCAGMVKVRSDGLSRKMGIAEPQTAPTTSFPGGGSGPSLIYYYYVYRASETGALSNPSPVSIPGTNAQSSPSASQTAATAGVINPNITVNGAQYEGNGTQIRTTGSVSPGTITDYIIARFPSGFSIPSNVTIDGVQIDLNWIGQNAGTGVLSGVQLYYLGSPIGKVKLPGVQNQSFSTDTLQGGNGDTWGAALTPAIVNDPTFGFGVQITTQNSGGSDRSFVNFMKIIVFYSTQNANITPTPSLDPQVDKIDFYRQGGGLANPTYVGTSQNTSTAFNDILSDLGAANNPILQFDNFEPFPSIDLPRKGTLNATNGVLTWVSGDLFNTRWLPGTIILIGNPTQRAYVADRRPFDTSVWDFTNNDPTVTPIPNGNNLIWNIAEPALAAQPLPSMWGPTDNSAYMFACYDQLRPGTLYFTKGNNPDSAPDTNQIEVTSPSEPLMNGYIIGGIGQVFSPERAWWIIPTFITALATVSGVAGSPFYLSESVTERGLYIRTCLCTEAGKNGFFRAKDGIYVSPSGQGSKSITDAIYNLFPHEQGNVTINPGPVVIGDQIVYPPDDTQPEQQKLSFEYGYLKYYYLDINGNPRTLVYDVAAKGWSVDVYQHPVTASCPIEGQANGVYVGCSDGTIRTLNAGNPETATSIVMTPSVNNGDARAFKRLGDVFFKLLIKAGNAIGLELFSNQYGSAVTGFVPTSLTGTGTLAPYVVDFTDGEGDDIIDIAAELSWPTASGNQIELWQPDFLALPATIQDQPTDWQDLGSPGMNFVQGMILECDTFGAAKAIGFEDELGVVHVPDQSPITCNGQQKIALTVTPPFTSHIGRLVSSDGVPWRRGPEAGWEMQWVSQPFPESTVEWQTELTDLGGQGWQHIGYLNFEYISTAIVTLAFVVDTGNGSIAPASLTLPSSGGTQTKVKLVVGPNKWKLIGFRASSSAKITVFKEGFELWVNSWGRDKGYRRVRPYGGPSSTGALV
jgi:hypothetical protein